ncbi:MAG: SRPBCC family protein [Solirubrobacteraceae bacterium]
MTTSGRYEQVQGLPVVRFERTFAHPVEAVWNAVTEPAQLGKWFPTTVEFAELRVGAAIEFHFPEEAYPPMSGEFREVEPPRRLVFTWGDDELTFELAERDGGEACRLAFTVVLDSEDKAARDSAGWEQCLDMLEEAVNGGSPRRPPDGKRWKVYFEEYKAQGLPATAWLPGQPRA